MMKIQALFFVWILLASTGCSGTPEAKCESACENVTRVVAEAVGEDGKPQGDISICVRTCLPQSPEYVQCLSSAGTMKELRECHGLSDT